MRAAAYRHDRHALGRAVCRTLLRTIGFTLLAKIDRVDGMEHIPASGPAILMMNHIAFIDPVVVVYVTPRDIVPLAKVEAYSYPLVGIFPRLWGVIPVQRHGIDRHAVQHALQVLDSGEILLVAPEGTRHKALHSPREGAVYLATRSGAPIIPVALEQTSGFPTIPFSKRWWGPGARVIFGRPFGFLAHYRHARGETLSRLADEAMYILAGMLPENRRGIYADLNRATGEGIEWR